GARLSPRHVPRADGALRARRPLVPGDRRDARGPDRHRHVATASRPLASEGRVARLRAGESLPRRGEVMEESRELELDLMAYVDGQLPPERVARIEAAINASPELKARVAAERALDARMRRALASDAGDVSAVRRM